MVRQSKTHTDRGMVVRTADPQTDTSSSEDVPTELTPDAPSADFHYAPGAPAAGSPVLFETETDEAEYRYEWSFGDDATATGAKASNVFDTAGRKEVSLTVTDGDGQSETVRRTLTVYRDVEVEVHDSDDELVAVTVRGDDFDCASGVEVESLRFGAPTALAMGTGAAPVRSEARDGDLRIWVRADESGVADDDSAGRLAGRTTEGVPIEGTADGTAAVR